MILFTSITIHFLFKSRRTMRAAKSHGGNAYAAVNQSNDPDKRAKKAKQHTSSQDSTRDVKFAITSFTLNLFFFIFNCPIVTYGLLTNYLNLNSMTNYIISTVTSIIYYFNFATIFYINIMVNSIFKAEFYSVFFSSCSKR